MANDSLFECNISALKFSDQERLFLRIIFLACRKNKTLTTDWLASNAIATKIKISTNHLKTIVRHCESKGGFIVILSMPGRYSSARKYELSRNLYEALQMHYKHRRQ